MGSIYSMQKRADGWVISVDDVELMTCSRRTTAIQVIRQAVGGLVEPGDAFLPPCGDEVTPRDPRPAA